MSNKLERTDSIPIILAVLVIIADQLTKHLPWAGPLADLMMGKVQWRETPEEASTRPGQVLLNGGTLDDPTAVTPTLEIYCERELGWAHLGGGMKRFDRAPG